MENEALIIFAKNPILGKVKTRLAKDIGDKQALAVYIQLLKAVHDYTVSLPYKKIIYWDGGIPTDHVFTNDTYQHKTQIEGDLGSKMANAFQTELNSFSSVCIIGTDCIELYEEIFNSAFQSLKNYDSVIGPALDGGYYLLGMNKMIKEIFYQMVWSTSTVFVETVKKLKDLDLSYTTLPTLSDVDTVDDYNKMREKNFIR